MAVACWLGGVVLALAVSPVPARADSLRIANITARRGFTPKVVQLSDLIVYETDEFGPPRREVLLRPNDSSDDIFFNIGSVITLNFPFKIGKYMISETENGVERRSIYLHSRSQVLTALLSDPAGNPLFLALDTDQALDPPAEGSILPFVNGEYASLPGWFVGTYLDLDAGEVSGPYTGDVLVRNTSLEVGVVPEPSSFLLFGAGVFGLLWYGRWQWTKRGQNGD
jgi:hypothetical protein